MKFSPDLGDHSVVWKSVLKLAGHDADNSEYLKWVFEIRGTPEAPQRRKSTSLSLISWVRPMSDRKS